MTHPPWHVIAEPKLSGRSPRRAREPAHRKRQPVAVVPRRA